MVRWLVTSGTAQERFERAVTQLGAVPTTRQLGAIFVEVSAELPEDDAEPIRLLLHEGVDPEQLTAERIEERRKLSAQTQGTG